METTRSIIESGGQPIAVLPEPFIALHVTASFTGIQADCWSVLIAELDKWFLNANKRAPYVVVNMPCGLRIEYKTHDDVPAESVPCPCGDPKHWVIRYTEGEK